MVRIINGSGKAIPCCYADCMRDAKTQHEVRVDHDAPRYAGEKLIYAFCCDAHLQAWVGERRRNQSPFWVPGSR